MRTALALGVLATLMSCEGRHPTDEALIRQFESHRAQLEEVVAMLPADGGIVEIDGHRFAKDPGARLADDRRAKYLELLDRAGIAGGVFCPHNHVLETWRLSPSRRLGVYFRVSRRGFPIESSVKGIYYRPPGDDLPAPEVASLDAFSSGPRVERSAAVEHVEGDWYLFYHLQ